MKNALKCEVRSLDPNTQELTWEIFVHWGGGYTTRVLSFVFSGLLFVGMRVHKKVHFNTRHKELYIERVHYSACRRSHKIFNVKENSSEQLMAQICSRSNIQTATTAASINTFFRIIPTAAA